MKHTTKALSILLAVLMLFSLCACNQPETDNTPSEPEELKIPTTVYTTWYSFPDVGVEPIVVNEDGTCTINGQQYSWVSQSI